MKNLINQNSSVAYYCHFTQTITLKRVEEQHVNAFLRALESEFPDEEIALVEGAQNFMRPMVHELRHWADMNCSIRGLQTLSNIFLFGFTTIHTLDQDVLRSNPYLAKLKKDLSLSFFVETHDPAQGEARYPWRFEITNSMPMYHEMLEHVSVCFFSQLDKKKEKLLFKSPIYLGSLLETTAYCQELIDAVPLLRGYKKWSDLSPMFELDEMNFIKDPSLPEYHCLAHAFASAGGQEDVIAAFMFASAVATILLHMPRQMFRESCKKAIYWSEKRFPQSGLRRKMEICPEAGLICHLLDEMALATRNDSSSFDEDLVYELFPYWKRERSVFFEKSHEEFKKFIDEHVRHHGAPNYFPESIPALIENNRYILEQQSLCPTLLGLPKRPPIFCGDGHILVGSPEFQKVIGFYEKYPISDVARAMLPAELAPGLVRQILPR
ncbi:hypothetical protein [Pseudomonas sp. Marseille-Q5115]|uniref:hypothetical protein n=1 Tax=Pseudomonas sp. Marseille-Q5115 TaxID=2866593 RepID=UPI001CE3CEFA|nr:hypothetical protein [Pseudomonas sp. Marseille-Q5115]